MPDKVVDIPDVGVVSFPDSMSDAEIAGAAMKLRANKETSAAPTYWQRHPNQAALARGTLDQLPAIGAVVGGAAATPETFGTGTAVGAALGAAAGRTLRDPIAEAVGLEPRTSVTDKASRGATEAAVTLGTAGLPEAATVGRAVTRGAIRAGGALADTVSPEVVGVISPRGAHILRVVQKLRDVAAKTAEPATKSAAVRLAGKAPALSDQLTGILGELRQEASPVARATVPGAAEGGSEAADRTMRTLRETGKIAQGNDVPVEAARYTPAPQPVPLNKAMSNLQGAAMSDKMKLTAVEVQAGLKLIQQGYPADGVLDAIKAQRALLESPAFANLPTSADVAAAVGERNAMGRWSPTSTTKTGNPFR